MTKTTTQPSHKIIGNVAPGAQDAYWVEFGAGWPTKSDPQKLALKLHSIPNDPNVALYLVLNNPKDIDPQQEVAV